MKKAKHIYDKRAFNIKEAADYACVSEGTVRNWIASRIIPFEEFPGRGDGSHKFRLIRKRDLDEFLDKHYNELKRVNNELFYEELTLLPKISP